MPAWPFENNSNKYSEHYVDIICLKDGILALFWMSHEELDAPEREERAVERERAREREREREDS